MNTDEIVNQMYNEMLERCGIENKKTCETKENKIEEKETGIGSGIGFERIRRITGYLVGDVSRWNNGKKAELEDREKHEFL